MKTFFENSEDSRWVSPGAFLVCDGYNKVRQDDKIEIEMYPHYKNQCNEKYFHVIVSLIDGDGKMELIIERDIYADFKLGTGKEETVTVLTEKDFLDGVSRDIKIDIVCTFEYSRGEIKYVPSLMMISFGPVYKPQYATSDETENL